MRVRLWVLVTMLFFIATTAFSSTVFSQPSIWSGNGTDVGQPWISHEAANSVGYRSFDNFNLSTTTLITSFTWRGLYYDDANRSNNPTGSNTSNWQVSVYGDDGANRPGTALYSDLTATVTTTKIGDGLFSGTPVNVWEMSYTFASPFLANAGTEYWISPLSQATDLDPLFVWIEGTNGDNLSYQVATFNSDAGYHTDDRAFSLDGGAASPVPEPASVVLVGSGVIAGLRRKLKK